MAQQTSLMPHGVPGQTRSFSAKTAATIVDVIRFTGEAVALARFSDELTALAAFDGEAVALATFDEENVEN